MRNRLIVVGLIALGILLIPVASQAAAPATMQLSSWRPDTSSAVVQGGEQTVTVTNTSVVALEDVTFPVDRVPCDCSIESYNSTHGQMGASVWTVGRLAPGETATLNLTYTRAPVEPIVGGSFIPQAPTMWLVGLVLAAGVLPVLLQRRTVDLAL
jgi:hypothetical protein